MPHRSQEWPHWAYHVTPIEYIEEITREGLKPHRHPSADEDPVIFVEPELEEVAAYHNPGATEILRFRTPGFGTISTGENVIFGGSRDPNGYPDPPLVGPRGAVGVIPPEQIQVLRKKKWQRLVKE